MIPNSNPNKATYNSVLKEWHVTPPAMNKNNNAKQNISGIIHFYKNKNRPLQNFVQKTENFKN